jgi:hypothetical protein
MTSGPGLPEVAKQRSAEAKPVDPVIALGPEEKRISWAVKPGF